MQKWKTAGSLVLMGVFPFLIQSCVSFLSAGPLGYETTALPVAVPESKGGASLSFVEAHVSLPSSIAGGDHSMNLAIGAGTEWSTPARLGFFFNFPVALSGFVGAAWLSNGLEKQYPDGVVEAYYGATLQTQPSLNWVNEKRDFRVGIGGIGWASGEAGPYAEFRSSVVGDSGHQFVDESPTPWSGGTGYWLEFALGRETRFGFRNTVAGVVPNLLSWRSYRYFIGNDASGDIGGAMLERLEFWIEMEQNRFLIGYSALIPLNASMTLAYTRIF